ncbi:TlyA family RNA methyltransferase [Ruminococcus flavefaciens]|uniref:TlyA family RNA methyltransferase n=1 Tax=Ruminococcus flavefaciens TaxID=1265 RepID=UPI0026EDA61C|nr:TlyA family RNA methyltransferase [Ruminococcus flavefaciens]
MARLDTELVTRGLARSRQRAKEMILSGNVTVNGRAAKKASDEVSSDDVIVSTESENYVGRGALKLEKAAEVFGLDLKGKVCLDIGASTGGFTDFMLQNGAAKVFAVDTGHGQLAQRLAEDPRVVSMEGTDIRDVTVSELGGQADFISVDVSFISLTKILSKVYELLKEGAYAAVLVKPQFEAGRSDIGKHGIVKDRKVHIRVLSEIDSLAKAVGFVTEQYTYSPVRGGSGNIEYLVKLIKCAGVQKIHDFKELTDSSFSKL